MVGKSKIPTLGLLRGIAVLSVCFCHFGTAVATGDVLQGFFSWIGHYGKYGVQIFFVISGFVIPYSLFKEKYELSYYFKFLYKRILRLHPPYLTALFVTFIVVFLSCKTRHVVDPENAGSLLLSIFYIHIPADNPVFWTLQIEAEYYIFIGLFFALLMKAPALGIVVVMPLLLYLSQTFLADYIGLLKYIVYFLIGIIGYLIYIKENNKVFEYISLLALIIFSYVYGDVIGTFVSLITVSSILFYRKHVYHPLEFPGEISYSLYLIHFIIGIKIINSLQRLVPPNNYWMLFPLAMTICIGIAWLFWKFIEKPAVKLSTKVKYGKQNSTLPYGFEIQKTM